ncbi:MAG TPA: hypothetical protein VN213_08975, partial [Solirubrobacteraceae bacterium]|nr:hypothetical protein [Solirubrobacteraceae bacterium]
MGDVIRLSERTEARRDRGGAQRRRAELFFDLGCPFTYLVAERVERTFADLTWTPASGAAMRRGAV